MSLSIVMFVISDSEYIFMITHEDETEYRYYTMYENGITSLVKGVLNDDILTFKKDGFFFEIPMENLKNLEARILG
jgi:hypothetical protein